MTYAGYTPCPLWQRRCTYCEFPMDLSCAYHTRRKILSHWAGNESSEFHMLLTRATAMRGRRSTTSGDHDGSALKACFGRRSMRMVRLPIIVSFDDRLQNTITYTFYSDVESSSVYAPPCITFDRGQSYDHVWSWPSRGKSATSRCSSSLGVC